MAWTVVKTAVFTVLDYTMPVLTSMEAVLRAVIQATQEKHVKSVSMQKEIDKKDYLIASCLKVKIIVDVFKLFKD